MKKELPHFKIGSAYGGTQEWCPTYWMNIDNGQPIPCLTLLHQHPSMEDYVWHWYIINGYEQFDNTLMVKTVTYGTWRWFDLATLWDTGKSPKGGLIIFS